MKINGRIVKEDGASKALFDILKGISAKQKALEWERILDEVEFLRDGEHVDVKMALEMYFAKKFYPPVVIKKTEKNLDK